MTDSMEDFIPHGDMAGLMATPLITVAGMIHGMALTGTDLTGVIVTGAARLPTDTDLTGI